MNVQTDAFLELLLFSLQNIYYLAIQAYSAAQAMQMIIFLATGNNKGGGYFASRGVFLCMYMGFTVIWAVLNSFALQVIAFLDIISIWWQVNLLPL